MTEQPASCTSETKLQEVAALMEKYDCGAIPVVENDRPAGIVTDRDITCRAVAADQNPLEMTAADVMTPEVVTAAPDETVEDVERKMAQHKVRRVVVVGNDNQVIGIVAQADISRQVSEAEAGDVVREISEPGAAPSEPGTR